MHAGEPILIEEIAHVCGVALKCQTAFQLSPTSIHFVGSQLLTCFCGTQISTNSVLKNLPSSTHIYPYPTNHITSLGSGCCLHCRPRGLPRSSLVKKVNTLLPLKPRCRPSKGKAENEVSFFQKKQICVRKHERSLKAWCFSLLFWWGGLEKDS